MFIYLLLKIYVVAVSLQEAEKKAAEEKRKRDEERIKKELEKARKEAEEKRLRELEEKRKLKEQRKAEEEARKKAEELKKIEEQERRETKEKEELLKKQMEVVKHENQVKLAKAAPWSQSNNTHGTSLAEIQKAEREKRAEQVALLQKVKQEQVFQINCNNFLKHINIAYLRRQSLKSLSIPNLAGQINRWHLDKLNL